MFKRSATLMILAILVAFAPPAFAQTTGTVQFELFKIGFIVGIGGGSGTLTYNGVVYPLNVGGVSVGTIGIAGVKMAGTASNLRTAADIVGTYGAASASLAVIGGGKVAQLQNEKGVILQVQGLELGVEASLSLGGMTISLK